MIKNYLLLIALLNFVNVTLAQNLDIQKVTPTSSRLYSVVETNTVSFVFSVVLPVSASSATVKVKINGVNYTQSITASGNTTFNWTSPSYGTFPVSASVVTNNALQDSLVTFNYKVISSTLCGVQNYSATVGYSTGDTVAVNDSVYRRVSFWAIGDRPIWGSSTWSFLGMCNSNMYQVYDCGSIAAWNSTTVYSSANNIVHYNSLVYSNNYWTQNNIPSNSPAEWKLKGACFTPNQLPVITTPYPADTVIVLNPLSTIQLPAVITDADGSISQVNYSINSLPIVSSNSASNYNANFTPTAYGNYQLAIQAIDDESGVTIKNSNLSVMPAIPPVINSTYPQLNQSITTHNNIASSIALQANVTDASYPVSSVTFSINGGTPISGTLGTGNNWTANWVAPAYASYTMVVRASNSQGAISTKTISFSLINPYIQVLSASNMPLQIKMNLGSTKTFVLGSAVTSVLMRNKSLAKIEISGDSIKVTGYRTGRTGLKIVTAGGTYYIGLRINKADGTAPGLPDFASIGFASEDSPSDLGFWEDMNATDLKNKNMDIRYIYINDGPIGYNTWRDSTRHITFCKNSLKYGLIPFFVYYNIPDGGESFEIDLQHMRDSAYMTAYFNDLTSFLRQCHTVMGDDMFGIVVEPDVLGYMQQLGVINIGTNNPALITTAVSATSIGTNVGTLQTLVTRINKTIKDRKDVGANIYYGWQMNLWSDGTTAGANGIMRSTDDLGWTNGRANVIQGATNVVNYIANCGVLSNGADFISMDKYGLDAAGHNPNISGSWWFNNDHWDNYMLYAKTVHNISNKPVILWQLPVGHLNNSTYTSAYTNTTFVPLPNTTAKYEDPSTTYFFGDTFVVNDPIKKAYFLQNNANDPSLKTLAGDSIVWGSHIDKFKEAGVQLAMFGAGVGISTNGIHDPSCITCGPSDSYFQIQKIQDYYKNSLVWLDTNLFLPTIYHFNKLDTLTHQLTCYTGPQTEMFYNENVQISGAFVPSNMKIGLNYITFVDKNGSIPIYKIIRVMIDTIPSGGSIIKLVPANSSVKIKMKCPASNNGWLYYKDPTDGKFVIAINPNNNTWNPDSLIIENQGSKYINALNKVGLSNRYITVKAPGTFTTNGGIKMRIFFEPADTLIPLPLINYKSWYKMPSSSYTAVQAMVNDTMLQGHIKPHISNYGTEGGVNYVEFDSLQSFSTFGYVVQSMNPIPLALVQNDFSLTVNNCKANLKWNTDNEENTISQFNIENSKDGNHFNSIATITSKRNNGSHYNYTLSLKGEQNFFRLKIVNDNLNVTYSKVIGVYSLCNGGLQVFVSPNPYQGTGDGLKVSIQTKKPIRPILSLISTNGKILWQEQKIYPNSGTFISTIEKMKTLPAGIYFLKITTEDESISIKVINE